jgi:hypothetical protein
MQRVAMKEASPIYKALSPEEKAEYIKIAEGALPPNHINTLSSGCI